jgi:MTH538 TIR-like domain (DUF1863)
MAKRAFYSFHYIPDNWRASQVRNMGVIEGNQPVSDNDWETVTNGGDAAIKKWIDDQLYGKSCAIILIGSNTANRKWINHEISTAWNENKAVLGVYVHNLKDVTGFQSYQGSNPFDYISFKDSAKKLSSVVKTYNPPYSDSKLVYNYINDNLADWIEEAIQIRENS